MVGWADLFILCFVVLVNRISGVDDGRERC